MNRLKKCMLLILPLVIVAVTVIIVASSRKKYEEYGIVVDDGSRLSIDEYIPGAMMSFVPVDYDEETMKAVAVMIRTYITQEFVTNDTNEIDSKELEIGYISPDTMKNTLGNELFEDTMERYNDAVTDTKSQVMTYNGEIIVPMYHMVSAGYTREASDYFNKDIPYMKSVECPEDVESEDYLKVVNLSKKEYAKLVKDILPKSKSVKVISRDSADYVTAVGDDNQSISGEEFASRLDLNSSCFSIKESDDGVQVVTKGQGHGMGMSIYGAWKLAKKGYTYDEILNYFFYGIKIE